MIQFTFKPIAETDVGTYVHIVELPEDAIGIQGYVPHDEIPGAYTFQHISFSKEALERLLPLLTEWLALKQAAVKPATEDRG